METPVAALNERTQIRNSLLQRRDELKALKEGGMAYDLPM